jgi:hypothetical protein
MVAPPRCVLSGSAVFVNDVACEVASSYLQHALLIPLKDISITKSEPDPYYGTPHGMRNEM